MGRTLTLPGEMGTGTVDVDDLQFASPDSSRERNLELEDLESEDEYECEELDVLGRSRRVRSEA